MTIRSNDTDFSYRLTESILSQTPSSTHSSDRNSHSTHRLVSPLPSNSIVFQQQDSNQSFNNYIGTHFKEDAPVLLSRIKEEDITEKTLQEEPYPSYYSPIDSERKINYFDEESSIFSVSTHFFSLGAFLFLFGFICPPLWWIGSFYPFRLNTNRFDGDIKMKRRWRLLNRFFSLGFSTLVVIAIIILAIIYSKT